MPDDLLLEIEGVAYGGWTAVSVVRSIEQASGGFAVRATEKWPGEPQARPIRPGSRCAIHIGPDTVITGSVDQVEIHLRAETHEFDCSGRDAVGDLIDCSPDLSPGEWLGLTVLDIARILAEPFGIPVTATAPVGAAFTKVTLDPGATAWEAIEELCKYRALLPASDGQGGLLLTRAGTESAGVAILEGVNLLEGELTLSWAERFSTYTAKGQVQATELLFGEAAAAVVGRASDEEVAKSRHRPKVVIAGRGITTEQAQQRAQWEATVRAGRSSAAVVTVQGWRQGAGGPLWAVNSLVRISSPTLGLDRQMLISELEHSLDENGRRTRLNLVRPDAFQLLAEPEEAHGGVGFDPYHIFTEQPGVKVNK